jgi:hypothetical protein
MGEDEAIALISREFMGEVGFLARLKQSQAIDRGALALVYSALAALEAAWADTLVIPKQAVLPLMALDAFVSRIEGAPEWAEEVSEIPIRAEVVMVGPMDAIERAVLIEKMTAFSGGNRRSPMSDHPMRGMSALEDGATTRLQELFYGEQGLIVTSHELRSEEGEVLADIKSELTNVRERWAKRGVIPRRVAQCLCSIYSILLHDPWISRQLKWSRLMQLTDELAALGRDCLKVHADESAAPIRQLSFDLTE